MPAKSVLGLICGCLIAFSATLAAAADGSILGLSPDVDKLELYAGPADEKAAHVVAGADLSFPAAILAVSNNGMYKIKYKDAEYWVISDDVSSSVERKVDTACDPKMAGSVVAHGKRGAGEGCQ